MYSEEEDAAINTEKLPVYRKGKEIFNMVMKITDLIPENDEYLMDIKACVRQRPR